MFKRKKKDLLIKKLEDKVQGMSEIIHDFENRIFAVDIYDVCTLISNRTESTSCNSKGREIAIKITLQEDMHNNQDEFIGKKIEFQLKHPRTVY